jgi:hypothetical protein
VIKSIIIIKVTFRTLVILINRKRHQVGREPAAELELQPSCRIRIAAAAKLQKCRFTCCSEAAAFLQLGCCQGESSRIEGKPEAAGAGKF